MNAKLKKILESRHVPQALLFFGPKKEIETSAYEFAKELQGQEDHPDLYRFFPEGKANLHSIQEMRRLQYGAVLTPYSADYKIFIIHEAEKMLPVSSNALLKTFEEPTKQTLFILLSSYSKRILPTVRSRCQEITFLEEKCEKSASLVLDFFQGKDSEDTTTLLEELLFWYRDRTLLELGVHKYLYFPEHLEALKKTDYLPLEQVEKQLLETKNALERSMNLNACLEVLRFKLSAAELM